MISTFSLYSPDFNDGIEWISEPPAGPAILHWTGDTIRVLDPMNGYERRLPPMLHPGLRGVSFVADACGAPAFLSWSQDGAVRVWDAMTGHLRSLEPMQCDGLPTKLEWVVSAESGPMILCLTPGEITFWDGATGVRLDHLEIKSARLGHMGVTRPFDGAAWIKHGRWAGRILIWNSLRIWLWNPATQLDELSSFLEHARHADNENYIRGAAEMFGDLAEHIVGVKWIDDAPGRSGNSSADRI